MVAFPAVPAPTAVIAALIAARIARRLLDSLAHRSGKRNQACAMCRARRKTRLKLQQPAACGLEMVQTSRRARLKGRAEIDKIAY
jgi:thiamine biosynthesis protein ThiC